MVIQQDMMARQMVFGKIDAPLEDISVHGAGGTLVLAGDDLHPVAAAESVVETHTLQGIGLAGAGARNGCQCWRKKRLSVLAHKMSELLSTLSLEL